MGLAETEAELAELEARRSELLALIGQAKAALALEPAGARPTLHSALAQVLRENSNVWMTARELADAVNTRGLYTKRDGRPVETNQVHARVKNYPHLFEKQGSRIRLQDSEEA